MTGASIFLSFVAGMALGGCFYGGLWLTVRRLATSRYPALLALGSFWVRSLIAVAGLVLLTKLGWQYGSIAAVGLLLSRLVIVKSVQEKGPIQKCT